MQTGSLTAGLADLALAAAQQAVRQYLDQEITYVAGDVAILDGNGKPWVRLPERPVRSVISVEEGDGTASDFATVDADDFVVRRSILYRVDGAVWTVGNVNLRVTYNHGWDVGQIDSDSDSDYSNTNNVPADIILATLSAARRMYEGLGTTADTSDIVQETMGSYSYTRDSKAVQSGAVELIPAERMILNRYRMPGVK